MREGTESSDILTRSQATPGLDDLLFQHLLKCGPLLTVEGFIWGLQLPSGG